MSDSRPNGKSIRSGTVICVVERDDAVRSGVKSLLETLGVTVKTYDSAESLLAEFNQSKVDCLITALELPGMSGLELLEWMDTHDRTVPTILLATDGDVATAVTAMRAGAVDFLEKPFVDRALLQHVKAILRQSS